jgi:hypothetical protein
MSWLDLVPTCDTVYVLQAALVCEDCAREIMAKLDKRGVADDGDSDTYPQGPHGAGGGEADSAHFCDSGRNCANSVKVANHKIGCPLGNPLTRDGGEALLNSIRASLIHHEKYGRMVGRLLRSVWGDYCPSVLLRIPRGGQPSPKSLVDALLRYRPAGGPVDVDGRWFCDVDHVYLLGKQLGTSTIHLLRLAVDDDGEFGTVEAALAPWEISQDYDVEKLISQAVEEGAWDT